MPAKPQSGRAIELGLALRIVSKRGRQVVFGQTGLLFANRQWGSQASGNNWQVYYPLVFNSTVYGVWINDYAAKNNNLQYVGVSEAESSLNGFKMYTSAANTMGIVFFAIGR